MHLLRRRPFPPSRTVVACLFAAAAVCFLPGCAMLHGWAQAGTDHPVRGGASVSVPLGK